MHFSKASRGQAQQEKVSFAQVIDDCLVEFEGHPNYYQLMLNVNIEGDDMRFENDLTRLKIILRNIISNAFEYMNTHAEMPYLHIDVKVTERQCKILFDDNGIGIHKDCLDKVFDMFYRACEISKGSGLGLYIVKQAIEKLHGSIQIASQEQKGTQVTVVLPNLAIQKSENQEVDQVNFPSLSALLY